jgi:hypothetical protein
MTSTGNELTWATGANAVMFNNRAGNRKAFGFALYVIMRMALFDRMAFFADKKLGEMTMRSIAVIMRVIMEMIMVAGDKCVQRFDAVDEPVTRKKLQRSVNRWRFWAADIGA